jgi:hypothetical protein
MIWKLCLVKYASFEKNLNLLLFVCLFPLYSLYLIFVHRFIKFGLISYFIINFFQIFAYCLGIVNSKDFNLSISLFDH